MKIIVLKPPAFIAGVIRKMVKEFRVKD